MSIESKSRRTSGLVAGQSLVEILVAIAVGAVLIIGAVSVIAPALQESAQAQKVQAGAALGSELASNIRAWSKSDWHNVSNLATSSAHLYYLNTSSSPFTAVTGTESIVIATTTYTRYFYLASVYRDANGNVTSSAGSIDPSSMFVTVAYAWTKSPTSTIAFYLTRYADNTFNQSNWSGGPGQSTSTSFAGSSFASSTNISYAISGAISITYSVTTTTYTGTGSGPEGIAFDGTNMWTANFGDNSVTKITPTGAMTTYTGTGSGPERIAFDGTNMWTTNNTVNSVTKVSPTGTMTTYTGTGSSPIGIAFDGTNMWTANHGGSVTKITPTGATTTYTVTENPQG
ncbi:MAG TPA: hypothetical protein VNG29_01350, partial [Candidatus Paceibacterota bacterium]|nr:hypothetical protein [Candidatus Paceibacterota bacterium]